MEIVEGQLSKLRYTVEVSGGGGSNHSAVSSTHVAVFQIGEQSVSFKSATPPILNEADIVIVAGTIKNGLLHAAAYRNKSTGVTGCSGSLTETVLGYIFSVIGCGAFIYGIASAPKDPSLLFVSL